MQDSKSRVSSLGDAGKLIKDIPLELDAAAVPDVKEYLDKCEARFATPAGGEAAIAKFFSCSQTVGDSVVVDAGGEPGATPDELGQERAQLF